MSKVLSAKYSMFLEKALICLFICSLAYTEMRLILARVIYNFRMELDGESKDWIERQKIYGLWEKVPLKVRLTPRWQ